METGTSVRREHTELAPDRPLEVALDPALGGERRSLAWRGQKLCLYAANVSAGGATPLLLIHSVNAAASAAEVKPLFDAYRAHRPVYALELPGFGSSDRLDQHYTPQLMAEAILFAAEHVRSVSGADRLDLLAVSLSCEFAARAALQQPKGFRSLALVSPTGFEARRANEYWEGGRSMERRWLHALLASPLWAKGLFRLLTMKPVMRYFLEKTWGSKQIDEGLLAYNTRTTRQPGARHAPFAFVSGALFTRGVLELYSRLRLPVWMAYGQRGEFSDMQGWRRLGVRADRWVIDKFDAGAMPYFEVLPDFIDRYDRFRHERLGDSA